MRTTSSTRRRRDAILLGNSSMYRFWQLSTIFLVFLTMLGLAVPQNAVAQQDSDIVIKAKKLVSEKHHIDSRKLRAVSEAAASYQFSKKTAHGVKFVDEKGNMYGATIDRNGQELNVDTLAKEDLAAKQAKYGKLEPSFAEKLAHEPKDKSIKANLWLKVPPFIPLDRPDPKSTLTPQQVDEVYKKVNARVESHILPVIASVTEKLKRYGYEAKIHKSAGLLSVEVPLSVLQEMQTWDEIIEIEDGEKEYKPALHTSRFTIGAAGFNNAGYTGNEVKVAQIEAVGGRIVTNNPFLPTTGITQDTTYVCAEPNFHATAVASVMKSLHDPHRGFAPNVSLYAGGSCDSYGYKLMLQATTAKDWGASVLNLSFGCIGCTEATQVGEDKYYDKIVYHNWRTVVAGAGNNGVGTGCGGDQTNKIYSPARGYNIITVGGFSDSDTTSWSDDILWPCSSWVNPTSSNNDREKPDVMTPGKNIAVLGTVSPWTELANGTSFAAPMVTAASALMIQQNSTFSVWPEMIKALTIATAHNNIDGNFIASMGQDSKDGWGGVNYYRASQIITNNGLNNALGSYTGGSITCSSTPPSISMYLTQGYLTRAALVFDVNPDYPYYANQPNMDLDFQILDPNGTPVAGSGRWDSSVEGANFYTNMSGFYTFRILRYRCDSTYSHTYYGAAWSQSNAN
jgi:hypothetical protein